MKRHPKYEPGYQSLLREVFKYRIKLAARPNNPSPLKYHRRKPYTHYKTIFLKHGRITNLG